MYMCNKLNKGRQVTYNYNKLFNEPPVRSSLYKSVCVKCWEPISSVVCFLIQGHYQTLLNFKPAEKKEKGK